MVQSMGVPQHVKNALYQMNLSSIEVQCYGGTTRNFEMSQAIHYHRNK
jgi:hypothetical protein